MKKLVLSLFLSVCCITSKSQIAVSYYPFQSLLSISSNTEKLFWLDYKVETNTFFNNMNMEFAPACNLKRTDFANYYISAGINFNPIYTAVDSPPLSGYFLTFGTRIKPLVNYRNVQVVFELSPYFNTSSLNGNLRTRLGIAYNFTRKKTSSIEKK